MLLDHYELPQYLDHTVFKAQHDRQLLQWLNNRPEDWSLSWGGATVIYGWGKYSILIYIYVFHASFCLFLFIHKILSFLFDRS